MEGHQGTQWVQDLPQTAVLVGQSFEPFKRLVLLRGPIRPQQTNIFHHPNPLPNS